VLPPRGDSRQISRKNPQGNLPPPAPPSRGTPYPSRGRQAGARSRRGRAGSRAREAPWDVRRIIACGRNPCNLLSACISAAYCCSLCRLVPRRSGSSRRALLHAFTAQVSAARSLRRCAPRPLQHAVDPLHDGTAQMSAPSNTSSPSSAETPQVNASTKLPTSAVARASYSSAVPRPRRDADVSSRRTSTNRGPVLRGETMFFVYPARLHGKHTRLDFERLLGVRGTARSARVVKALLARMSRKKRR
jgi:hypothetical protein